VGPFLGQHGFHTINFCALFNSITKIYPDALPLKVNIKLFTDKTILFEIKTPPTSFLLHSASAAYNFQSVTMKDLIKILWLKKIDIPNIKNLSLLTTILGTLSSIKLTVVN
jgi:ribosomal protein L11